VGNLARTHRPHVQRGERQHGNGSTVSGHKLDLERRPVGVAVHHRSDITGPQAVLSDVPLEDDAIELANHHHPPHHSG
jgi:hypothetical protein